jgi:hypothetical protein
MTFIKSLAAVGFAIIATALSGNLFDEQLLKSDSTCETSGACPCKRVRK